MPTGASANIAKALFSFLTSFHVFFFYHRLLISAWDSESHKGQYKLIAPIAVWAVISESLEFWQCAEIVFSLNFFPPPIQIYKFVIQWGSARAWNIRAQFSSCLLVHCNCHSDHLIWPGFTKFICMCKWQVAQLLWIHWQCSEAGLVAESGLRVWDSAYKLARKAQNFPWLVWLIGHGEKWPYTEYTHCFCRASWPGRSSTGGVPTFASALTALWASWCNTGGPPSLVEVGLPGELEGPAGTIQRDYLVYYSAALLAQSSPKHRHSALHLSFTGLPMWGQAMPVLRHCSQHHLRL